MMKTFTVLLALLISSSSQASPCPAHVVIPAGLLNSIMQQAMQGIDLEMRKKLEERIVVVLKLEVTTQSLEDPCTYRKSIEIFSGKKNEQIYSIVANANVTDSNQNRVFALVPGSLKVQTTQDAYSTLTPSFNTILAEEREYIKAQSQKIGIIGNAFKDLRPALAVRGAGCLMCHAIVNSTMVTDFGYGDQYFFEQDHGKSMYFNYTRPASGADAEVKSWQDGKITQKLIIPKVNLDPTEQEHAWEMVDPKKKLESITLAEYLMMPNVSPARPPMAAQIGKVEARSKVYIGAPTRAEILAISKSLTNVEVGFSHEVGLGWSKATELQLEVKKGATKDYVTNKEAILDCDGDIVIKGTLFLNNVTLRTGADGCRFYVSGSVFIQPPPKFDITVPESSPIAQFTSAEAIIMGFNTTILKRRLGLHGVKAEQYIADLAWTRAGPGMETHQVIFDQATNLGALLVDAGETPVPTEGLLLNAPEVHSRYRGDFTGSVIAELALFRVGEFRFKFDDRILRSDILPLLPRPILEVSKQ